MFDFYNHQIGFETKENNRKMSPSSSSVAPERRYDVFPSFRGPDVRRSFLSHLLNEFKSKGIKTFNDKKIQKGKSISPALKQAIRESRIYIIILSKNYASSSWCLRELVEIMECRKTCGKMVLTIFYEVDPTDVRKQKGEFGMAYRKACEKVTEKERQSWKQALTNVANILGEHSREWDSEALMVSKISEDISNKLNFTASRDFDALVGIDVHIAEMSSLLCLESEETRMVGIWGPVGIGKTTIARAIYNLIARNFQRRLFMENVKTSYRSGDDFDTYALQLRLQEKFLSQILDHQDLKIFHLGTAEDRLKFEKVLVVLDDIDKLEQLHALADGPHWFGNGSRIVVTTEDKQLLEAHGITLIYQVDFPSRHEALEIFSQSAFTQNAPPKSYLDLALEVTELTSHLPLGLSVLGKALRGKSVSRWEYELPRIRTSLNRDIEKVLRVGYNGLDDKDKAIFLHIACLFEGETVDCVVQFLANCGLDINYGLLVLVERAIISLMIDKTIIMHRLLRQMGREIVRRHACLTHRKCHFFMGVREICDVIADITGTANVLGILFDTSKVSEKALSGMHDHQFVKFSRNLMDKGSKLEKLWGGIKDLVFLRLPQYVFSMFWLLKYGFLSIMSMSPPAFANIRFGMPRRVFPI